MVEEVNRGKREGGKRTTGEIRMEDMGDSAEGIPRTPWQTGDPPPRRECDWVDVQEERDTIPLLDGEEGPLLNPDTPPEWLGPWNTQGANPFKLETPQQAHC